MYQGRRVTLVPDDDLSAIPAGSTVIYDRKHLARRGFKPMKDVRNIVVSKEPTSKALADLEFDGEELYVSPELRAAVCMGEAEVYVLGSNKLRRAAEAYAGDTEYVPTPAAIVPASIVGEIEVSDGFAFRSSAV